MAHTFSSSMLIKKNDCPRPNYTLLRFADVFSFLKSWTSLINESCGSPCKGNAPKSHQNKPPKLAYKWLQLIHHSHGSAWCIRLLRTQMAWSLLPFQHGVPLTFRLDCKFGSRYLLLRSFWENKSSHQYINQTTYRESISNGDLVNDIVSTHSPWTKSSTLFLMCILFQLTS